jgi:hypothetical protein
VAARPAEKCGWNEPILVVSLSESHGAVFMAPARSAIRAHRAHYTAPPQTQLIRLRDLLQIAKRGPMWNTRQLDIFKPDAKEPHDLTLFLGEDVLFGRGQLRFAPATTDPGAASLRGTKIGRAEGNRWICLRGAFPRAEMFGPGCSFARTPLSSRRCAPNHRLQMASAAHPPSCTFGPSNAMRAVAVHLSKLGATF